LSSEIVTDLCVLLWRMRTRFTGTPKRRFTRVRRALPTAQVCCRESSLSGRWPARFVNAPQAPL